VRSALRLAFAFSCQSVCHFLTTYNSRDGCRCDCHIGASPPQRSYARCKKGNSHAPIDDLGTVRAKPAIYLIANTTHNALCLCYQRPFCLIALQRSQSCRDFFKAVGENLQELSMFFIVLNGDRFIWTFIIEPCYFVDGHLAENARKLYQVLAVRARSRVRPAFPRRYAIPRGVSSFDRPKSFIGDLNNRRKCFKKIDQLRPPTLARNGHKEAISEPGPHAQFGI
jgi:hypothetical protein